jgi:hypothetical protein
VIDPHRLAEERSVAYHRVVAERLEPQPVILERARARVQQWREEDPSGPYAEEWARILSMPLADIKHALVEDSEAGRARRQATPFAGAIPPRERWKLWRLVREELSR